MLHPAGHNANPNPLVTSPTIRLVACNATVRRDANAEGRHRGEEKHGVAGQPVFDHVVAAAVGGQCGRRGGGPCPDRLHAT